MTTLESVTIQYKRLASAVAVVCAITFGVAVSGMATDGFSGGTPDVFDASFLAGGGQQDPYGVLDVVEARLDETEGAPTDVFLHEVGIPAGARDIRVSEDGGVVGYTLDSGCSDALDAVKASFEKRAWVCVDMGGIEGCTFLKQGEPSKWALATATQVGDASCVVVRSVGI